MKKIKLFFITLSLFLTLTVAALADEQLDGASAGWNTIMSDYNKNQYTRPVTEKEFNQAIQTLQQYQPKKKKKKKHWWSRETVEEEATPATDTKKEVKKEFKPPEIPESPNPLLRLPFPVVYKNNLVKDGFYLVDAVVLDKKYYLRFKQGHQVVALVEASESKRENSRFGVSLEASDNMIKVKYQDTGVSLEANLPVYKGYIEIYR